MNNLGYRVEDNFNVEKSVVDAAKAHYNNGKFDMAIKLYKSLLNTNASSRLYLDLGLCYYRMEEYDKSIEYLSNSINLDNSNSVAYSFVGNCYFKKLDANNAIENWITARSISPKDEFVCLNLAISYFAKNMVYESVYFYDKYLKYAQDKNNDQYKSILKNINEKAISANELFTKSQNQIRRKEYSLAEQNLISAIKKYPLNSQYAINLADIYFDRNNFSNAVIYYELACRDNFIIKKDISKKLAECYQKLNNYRLAYCYYKRYLGYNLSNQSEYLEITKLISELKKQLDSSNINITLEMARIHYKNNEYFQSLLEYENYVLLNPENKQDVEQEIKKLKAFLNSEDGIIKNYMEKAKNLIKQGEKSGANKYFTEILTLSNPKSNEYKIAKSRLTNV